MCRPCARAAEAAGNIQSLEPAVEPNGFCNDAVQRVLSTVV